MTLQTSGAISLSQVQSEFGGSNPISMSEYYRNGSNVPSTITTGAGAWSSYQYSRTGSNDYYWSHNIFASLRWAGGTVPSSYLGASTTSYSYLGYTYERGSFVTSITTGSGKSATTTSYYYIRRRQNASTITVNSNVPTSGAISMDDFYGGRKT